MKIKIGEGFTAEKWMITESWWAESFDVPGQREFLRWMFGIAPWFVFAFFGRFVTRAVSRPETDRARSLRIILALWPLVLIGLPLAAIIAILLLPLLLPASLLGLLPGPIGGYVRRTVFALTRSIGDSYALIASPRREAAILHKIHQDLVAVDEQIDPSVPVAIVAHSQGAALAHRVLKELGAAARPVEETQDPLRFVRERYRTPVRSA